MGEPSHYFSASPDGPSTPHEFRLSLPERGLRMRTDRGVFSAQRIDPGTQYLLTEAPGLPSTGTFLDLGCGYGPIAVTMGARAPGAAVWATDVNERARGLCEVNAEINDVTNVHVTAPDDVPPDLLFDVIWSNPPIRIGKLALQRLLQDWLARLTPTGWALLVVQKYLGSDSLHAWLRDQGWAAERIGSRRGYRLLEVRRHP